MHEGKLARSPSLAQAELIQRLNPVTVARPPPPKLTPATAASDTTRLRDEETEGRGGPRPKNWDSGVETLFVEQDPDL